jgi:hypothetical protein
MSEKVYKKISKEEYEQLQQSRWERISESELFYRTTAIRRFWRPAMAWLYFLIVLLDFIVFPIMFIQAGGTEYKPITLQGGGLFHVAMGAIVATASIGRSWEKMNQYRMDQYPGGFGYDPYTQINVAYPGSPPITPQMMPRDNIGDALSNNEDEIIPNGPGQK